MHEEAMNGLFGGSISFINGIQLQWRKTEQVERRKIVKYEHVQQEAQTQQTWIDSVCLKISVQKKNNTKLYYEKLFGILSI